MASRHETKALLCEAVCAYMCLCAYMYVLLSKGLPAWRRPRRPRVAQGGCVYESESRTPNMRKTRSPTFGLPISEKLGVRKSYDSCINVCLTTKLAQILTLTTLNLTLTDP